MIVTDPPVETAALLSVVQVAEMLGCSPRHVLRLADSGQFPRPICLGSKLKRWLRSTVEEHLTACSTAIQPANKNGGQR
jgi:predicted DNA-binding transcriptional regulator AlpA